MLSDAKHGINKTSMVAAEIPCFVLLSIGLEKFYKTVIDFILSDLRVLCVCGLN
jgi:hypothetical protein